MHLHTVFFLRVVFAIVLSVSLCAPLSFADSSAEKLWQETLDLVRDDFPSVNHISTEELAAMLDGQQDFALLDTREREEYSVSHIEGAELAEDVGDALKALEDRDRNDLVVVYCSVGYRSSKIAERLMRRGFTNVVNLEGSLFKWANEDRPVYSGSREVSKVHPYDRSWGRLLDRKYWP